MGGPAARQPACVARALEPDRPGAGAGPRRPRRALAATAGRGAAGSRWPPRSRPRCRSSRSSWARSSCSASPRGLAGRARRARPARRGPARRARDGGAGAGPGRPTLDVALAPLDLVHATRATLGLPPPRPRARAFAALWIAASLGVRMLIVLPAWAALRGPSVPLPPSPPWPSRPGRWACCSASRRPRRFPGQTRRERRRVPRRAGRRAALDLRRASRLGRGPRTRCARWAIPWRSCRRALASVDAAVRGQEGACRRRSRARAAGARDAALGARRAGRATSCLQRPGARFPPLPVVLAGRRVPYERFTPYLTQFLSREDAQRRHDRRVYRFFRTADVGDARRHRAASSGARFVCLYGTDRVRFDLSAARGLRCSRSRTRGVIAFAPLQRYRSRARSVICLSATHARDSPGPRSEANRSNEPRIPRRRCSGPCHDPSDTMRPPATPLADPVNDLNG